MVITDANREPPEIYYTQKNPEPLEMLKKLDQNTFQSNYVYCLEFSQSSI